MSPDELNQIKINLRAAYERGKTGEALAAARRLVADRRAGRGTEIGSEPLPGQVELPLAAQRAQITNPRGNDGQ